MKDFLDIGNTVINNLTTPFIVVRIEFIRSNYILSIPIKYFWESERHGVGSELRVETMTLAISCEQAINKRAKLSI